MKKLRVGRITWLKWKRRRRRILDTLRTLVLKIHGSAERWTGMLCCTSLLKVGIGSLLTSHIATHWHAHCVHGRGCWKHIVHWILLQLMMRAHHGCRYIHLTLQTLIITRTNASTTHRRIHWMLMIVWHHHHRIPLNSRRNRICHGGTTHIIILGLLLQLRGGGHYR